MRGYLLKTSLYRGLWQKHKDKIEQKYHLKIIPTSRIEQMNK